MSSDYNIKAKIVSDGFAVVDNIFTAEEINEFIQIIDQADSSVSTFHKATDLYAIRQFFKVIPASINTVFKAAFVSLIVKIFGDGFFVVKSIYFDKPKGSNWFVSYHQDLTISVNKKIELPGFNFWTTKQNLFAVQPPLNILKDNFTVRIHLDDTGKENGALRVIPKSHLKDIYRPETIDWTTETENICTVKKGGVMFMKPLLLHSSGKTVNNNRRRVIHIEFSRSILPADLLWSEFLEIKISS
ncbi:MAG: hypothetical protein RIR31_1191 [Bacteroidota bacterium]|jgi:Phytanoyl-CoA dioxygenase (PhyH)